MCSLPVLSSGKEQDRNTDDRQNGAENRLPANLLFEHEITDRQNDHGRQRHEGINTSKACRYFIVYMVYVIDKRDISQGLRGGGRYTVSFLQGIG